MFVFMLPIGTELDAGGRPAPVRGVRTWSWAWRWAWLCAAVGLLPATARARIHEAFESPLPSWELAETDCHARLAIHRREFGKAHAGNGCEYVRVLAGQGTKALLTHPIDPSRVIQELKPSVWVKSDQPGLQLMVRVVLPRTPDPRTGRPLTALLRGPLYTQPGAWQRLVIEDCERLLSREVVRMSWQLRQPVAREQAFIDLVVLNAYGGPGVTNVWLDDLEIANTVVSAIRLTSAELPDQKLASRLDGAFPPSKPRAVGRSDLDWGSDLKMRDRETDWPAAEPAVGGVTEGLAGGQPGGQPPFRAGRVQLAGDQLLLDGRPFAARVIQYNGESLDWLQALGFNGVLLSRPASAELQAAAARLNMWLVSPPPAAPSGRVPGQDPSSRGDGSTAVLAWYLGSELSGEDLPRVKIAAQQLRDSGNQLPLLGGVSERHFEYSQLLSLSQVTLEGLSTSRDLEQQQQRLHQQIAALRRGSCYWLRVETEPPLALLDQQLAFGVRAPPIAQLDQWRSLVAVLAGSGARGIIFGSRSRLDADDEATRTRRKLLELANLELSLLDPWLGGGSEPREGVASEPLSVRQISTPRSRLMIVRQRQSHDQLVRGPAARPSAFQAVGGIPVTYAGYSWSQGQLAKLSLGRGGIGLRLASEDPVQYVVLTDDTGVEEYLRSSLRSTALRRSRLVTDLLALEWQRTRQVLAALPQRAVARVPLPGDRWETVTSLLPTLERDLRAAEEAVRDAELAVATQRLSPVSAGLGAIRRTTWEQAIRAFPNASASPICMSFEALPTHYRLLDSLAGRQWSGNALPGGSMETLQELVRSGWSQEQVPAANFQGYLELAPQNPHGGGYALRMWSRDEPPAGPPGTDTPFRRQGHVRVSSPPVAVHAGDLVQLQVWLRIPEPLEGGEAGCSVWDSLGGEQLAVQLRQTVGWQLVSLYRAAPRDGQVQLHVVLDGIGQVWVDDASAHLLAP